jgi:uncharacterized protein (DUF1697 family)
MRGPLSPEGIAAVLAQITDKERFGVSLGALWVSTQSGQSASALVRAVNSRRLGEGTMRSVSALRKIADVARD